MSNDSKNYYEVLEVSSTARSEEIYLCYQRAKSAYSSDSLALYSLMNQEECRNVLELVEEAYIILADPMKRKFYDEARGFNREFNSLNYNTLSDSNHPIRSESVYGSNSTRTSSSSSNLSYSANNHLPANQTHQPGATSFISGEMSAKEAQTLSNSSSITKLVNQKRFYLDYIVNSAFEKEIEEATEFTGELLRKIREYKCVDLERLSDMTKVSRLYLQAIESEDFDRLPAPVYVRGFVFQYAKCIKLKPEVVANSFVARMKKLKP